MSVDPGIERPVLVLQSAGFKTTGSCQGGPGHAFQLPTIQVELRATLPEERIILVEFVQSQGWACTVSEHYMVQSSGRVMPESYIELEFWTLGAL